MKRPETPNFASKKSIHLDLSKSKIFSFVETCGPVIKNQSLFNFNSKRTSRQDPKSEKLKITAESLSIKIIENFNSVFSDGLESEKQDFQSKITATIEDFFKTNDFSSILSLKPDDLGENLKKLMSQIEKISTWRFFHCETFSRFSSVLLKNIENSTAKTLKFEDLIKDLQKKLKELKKKIKNLFEQLKITEFPSEAKKV